ncbi:protein tramtrack, beta isoform-like isoform X10 [Euwallacea fornicatus]|uniref:protein tramtrack, beta isoform-like isoform X10 n=1 Tax=Euwallacea fornicatus TaxID=995702 RepID=UPI00338F144F
MASEQFSLCWDNFHKNMSSGMNSLLESGDLVDVTLAVEGKFLKAHKMVLSVCSPYFKELFKTNPCQHPIVFMKDVSYVAISDLLQFMYQGEVQVSQDNLTTFIKTAEALQIKGLTGDGNGSTDADSEPVQEKPARHIDESYKPSPRPKKQLPTPVVTTTPAVKRPRLSASSNDSQSAPIAIAKTEPSSTGVDSSSVQFKVEPYDLNQSVTIPDDGDDNFDENLDDNTVDDTEDYSMMEGEEPQAGTSTDGTGEGQDYVTELNSLPEKSRKKYELVYKNFMDWCASKDFDTYTEDVVFKYFEDLAVTYSSSTMWVYYSMLRSTLIINNNINIEKYHKLRTFLKIKSKGYQGKKSKLFTQEEIDRFIFEAPDQTYLATKVAIIFGIMGACRTNELHAITTDDIQDFGTAMMVSIPSQSSKVIPRQFTITGAYYQYCANYMQLRPDNSLSKAFFLNYQKGKCTVQHIGINKFGAMGKEIAGFLNLADPHMYTGYSFRRSTTFKAIR